MSLAPLSVGVCSWSLQVKSIPELKGFMDRLGIDLYLVALFAFGWRIFQNVAVIRRHFL